jgi:hypothetical protein
MRVPMLVESRDLLPFGRGLTRPRVRSGAALRARAVTVVTEKPRRWCGSAASVRKSLDLSWRHWIVLVLVACINKADRDAVDQQGSTAILDQRRQELPGLPGSRESGNRPPIALQVIGDASTFGRISDIEEISGGRFVVLDGARGTVELFAADGRPLSSFGRRGTGPGQFMVPVALARDGDGSLLVLDRGSARLTILTIDGNSLRLTRDTPLPFTPRSMCHVRGKLIILADQDGALLHELSLAGELLRSFGVRGDGSPLINALTALGKIACSDSAGMIALTPTTLGHVHIYSVDGQLLRIVPIPGYSETIYDITGDYSVRPKTPASGFAHKTSSLHWMSSTRLFVQYGRIPAGSAQLESRFLTGDGETHYAPEWPEVVHVSDTRVYAVKSAPYPHIMIYTRQ